MGARPRRCSQSCAARRFCAELADEQESAASRGIVFGLVGDKGAISGSAAGVVPPRIGRQVAAGRSVSTTIDRGGSSYVVEGRPRAAGGGVVAAQPVDDIVRSGRAVTGFLLTNNGSWGKPGGVPVVRQPESATLARAALNQILPTSCRAPPASAQKAPPISSAATARLKECSPPAASR